MKDKLIQIRADAEFLSKLEYLQIINGFKSISETIRKIVEKEWRKERASDVVRCADCKYLEDGDWCTENIRPVCLDSFCSWASRKGNE